jgi:recombination protein RecR
MFEGPIQRLIDELARLPGIGRKSAQRLAFHLLNTEDADAQRLASAIVDMRSQVRLCSRCFNVTGAEECSICRDLRRDPAVVCVVERAQEIVVIEKTQEFRGKRPRSSAVGITCSVVHFHRSMESGPGSCGSPS